MVSKTLLICLSARLHVLQLCNGANPGVIICRSANQHISQVLNSGCNMPTTHVAEGCCMSDAQHNY